MKNEVTYIKRKNLDTGKYDACIEGAINSQIYAFSWYLDCVADDWDVLVLGDYEVVMPVPFLRFKRHLFIKKIYQPDFCQQLGVFSKEMLSQKVFSLFLNKFISLQPKSYQFNSFDSTHFLKETKGFLDKVNYELSLSASYDSISANYSKNLKRNIKKAEKTPLRIGSDFSKDTFIRFKKDNFNYRAKRELFEKMNKLIGILQERNIGNIYAVFDAEKPIAACLVLHHKNKLITLFSATNSIGKKYAAFHFLVNRIIENNVSSNIVLDFEGSMIPGVARFNKSFGAEKKVYKSLR